MAGWDNDGPARGPLKDLEKGSAPPSGAAAPAHARPQAHGNPAEPAPPGGDAQAHGNPAASAPRGDAQAHVKPVRPAEPAPPREDAQAHLKPAPERAPELPARRIVTFMLAWMALWWGILGALFAPVLPGGWITVLLVALVAAAPLIALVRGFVGGAYPSAATRVLLLRPFWYVQLLLPLLATAGAVGALVGLPFSAPGAVGRVAVALAAVALGALALAGYAGSRHLVVRHLDVVVDGLPAALDGLRIAQVSDLHVGPHTSRRFLRRIAAAIREARPDLVASTGDQVDDYARDVAHFAAVLHTVEPPLGVFAIAGNHDVYAGWTDVRRGLEQQGVRVLVNEAVPLEHRGQRFWLAGTGDPAGWHWSRAGGAAAAPDVERTLAAVPVHELAIVLAHNPALWPRLPGRGPTLTLSGHTHHGQFSIPSLGWSLASPFLEHAMGVHARGESLLYIHPGTNYWGIPFRIGALPEVAVLTLRRGERGSAILETRAA